MAKFFFTPANQFSIFNYQFSIHEQYMNNISPHLPLSIHIEAR